MGMTIADLIMFCEEKEYNHRVSCKRYDNASGYTRSKDKSIRSACAIREETNADFYKEISNTMRKYQKIQMLLNMDDANHRRTIKLSELKEILEDGNNIT